MQGPITIRTVSRYFQVLAPLIALCGYVLVGEIWLLTVLVAVPAAALLAQQDDVQTGRPGAKTDLLTGLLTRDGFEDALSDVFGDADKMGLKTAVFLLEINDFRNIRAQHGEAASDAVLKQSALRIRAALRQNDIIARIGEGRIAICLSPSPTLEPVDCLQLAARLQMALEEPVALPVASILPSWSIGLHQSEISEAAGRCILDHTTLALEDALRNGASTLRVYSDELARRATRFRRIEKDVVHALDRGEITAWFQPQISTDTGAVSGFEALARWQHPRLGLIPPFEFLPLLQKHGQSERLTSRMLTCALEAMQHWQAQGLDIPVIGVNFAAEDLMNTALPDKVAWALDRHNLGTERLAVEILENVAAGPEDGVVIRNINRLAAMGCHIDLDDFGTGRTSISAIRRLAVSRLKIDRSFVTRVDQDGDQRRMITAILTMCERLGLETVAEGVETAGEHSMLAQLGCTHVQGYGIARPMPLKDTVAWVRLYDRQLQTPPEIGRRTS